MATPTGSLSRGCDLGNLEHFAFGEKPLDWRLPTREGLTWRFAVRDDLPALHALWDEMDAKLGEKQDRPDLFAMPVQLTLVAVDDATGKILSAVYGEAVVDWTMIGTSRRVMRTARELHPWLGLFLFSRSIRVSRILVPRRMERHMQKMLPGLRNITQSFAQFVCNLRA